MSKHDLYHSINETKPGVSTHVDCIMADATRLPFRKCTSFFDIVCLTFFYESFIKRIFLR
jgi:hypothetical protein